METIKARTFLVAVAFVVFGMTSTAAAQPIHPECPERPTYDKDAKALAGNWFKRAQDLVAEKKYDEALAGFGCSYSIVPHPATLFNMSQTARLARKQKLALELIRKYLQENPEGPYAETLEDQLVELVKTLDEPLDGPTEPEEDTDTETGDEGPDTETTQTPEEPLPPPAQEESSKLDYRILAYSSFGVAGASAAVGVIMTVLSVQAKQDAEDSHGGSYQKAKDFEEKSKGYRVGAILGYTGAALLTATGIVLMVKDPNKNEDAESAQVQVVPTLGGLVVKGVF